MKQPASALCIDHVLKGTAYTYHIDSVLSQGRFGITYLATTTISVPGPSGTRDTRIHVAVKEFCMREFCSRHEDGTISEMTHESLVANYAGKFRKDAENLAKLSHPNIVKVLEVFEANNTTYYAMKYIPGGSLDDYVKRQNGLSEEEAIACIHQIGSALSYMHDHKMLHLDLKPSNVMRSAYGRLTLIDFGLSKQYEENGNPESSTSIGLGTPGYAPIEQSSSDLDRDFAPTLDVYALGATFFKLLTGQTPPQASAVLDEGLPINVLQQKGISSKSIEALEQAMEPRKSKRLKTVDSFLSALAGTPDDDVTEIDNPKKQKPSPAKPSKPEKLQPKEQSPKLSLPKWLYGVAAAMTRFRQRYQSRNQSSQASPSSLQQSTRHTQGGTMDKHNVREYVDLGLPSGLLWATCNVGASSPSDYGNYYAWGETGTKSIYNWENLEFRASGDLCNNVKFSKYVASSRYGKVDNKTCLDLSDDAARANWGGGWRMPAIEEWRELRNSCTWIWTNHGGHNGYKVIGKNGAYIFLPAAGGRDGSSLYLAGSWCFYWSRSLNGKNDRCDVYGLFSNPRYGFGKGTYRYCGLSVRPVASLLHSPSSRLSQGCINGKHNGQEYVDLGLPSGLLWSTCNVGASSPSDYGNYYAWGETGTKNDYSWENLKYWISGKQYINLKFSKYVATSKYGNVDNKTCLDLSDDAARANWGGSWRMPTVDEWKELKSNCTWTWTRQGGHNGYKVTGKNGAYIFLPAAGYRIGSSLLSAGEGGDYWSSSLYTVYSYSAFSCYFNSDYVGPSYCYDRYFGHSVRPVVSSLQK